MGETRHDTDASSIRLEFRCIRFNYDYISYSERYYSHFFDVCVKKCKSKTVLQFPYLYVRTQGSGSEMHDPYRSWQKKKKMPTQSNLPTCHHHSTTKPPTQ